MSSAVELPLGSLERALGVAFRDPRLRETALTHRSYAFEQGEEATHGAPLTDEEEGLQY